MLSTIRRWLQVAEDRNFVYVRLTKQDNFYQLPVVVKTTTPVTGGLEATVDVYSIEDGRLIYSDLTVVMVKGSPIAGRVIAAMQQTSNLRIYLLGIFSVNLSKAAALARGHGRDGPVSGLPALEFFAFGVPTQQAVASSACDVEEDNVPD